MSTPEEQGMDSEDLANLVDFGAKHSFDSLLVVRHGTIVAEAYYAPYAPGIPHAVNSVTKAVISTLVAIVSEEGLLESPSHQVLDLLDRRGIVNLDDRKESITVQNLLDMTSGLNWMQPPYGSSPSVTEMLHSPDWVKFILDRPMSNAPGDAFNYSDGDAQLLSAIITRLTGMSAMEYAKAKLFGPLGIKEMFWAHDPQGISMAGYGLYLQPRGMAKIGYLYLRNGVWEGKQLLPPQWIDKIAHSNTEHSNLFWVLPGKHVYMALGAYRQVIMVFPDLDVVTVTTARVDDYSLSEWDDAIAKSVKSDKALPADAPGAKLLASKIADASTEKPNEVGPPSKLATIISGKVYGFAPNQLNLKSVSFFLTDPQPHYVIETYASDAAKAGQKFSGPIGLDGLYRKGRLTGQGFNPLFEGFPRVYALKGAWEDDHTFVIDWMTLGQGQPTQTWTLSFAGDERNVRVKYGALPEIFINGKVGQ